MNYNLIPSSHYIPKDGNCLFHSIAQIVGERDHLNYEQEDIRTPVVAYLEQILLYQTVNLWWILFPIEIAKIILMVYLVTNGGITYFF